MKPDNTRIASAKPDAEILAAWVRITAAHAALAACPVHAGPGEYSPAERAQWDIVDAAEAIIRTTKATTPAGVEVQLWVGLIHLMNDDGVEQAILRRDLDWFDERDGEFDWFERLFIAAIRSLRSMAAPREHDDAPSPFATAMQAYRDASNMAICFHLLYNPGEGVGTDEQWADFETAFGGYVDMAGTAARAALMTPATSAADMVGKQTILEEQDGFDWQPGDVEAYTRQLIADAVHLAGESA